MKLILFPIGLSLCACICLGYAVLDCNYIEVTNGWKDVKGVSVGFWRTEDEINGNFESPGRNQCVFWTPEQVDTFDAMWNFGRYAGVLSLALSVVVTLLIMSMSCIQVSRCTEILLGACQFFLALSSALMMIAFGSHMCTEFDCWLDIGGVLTIVASVLFFMSGWITLSLRASRQSQEKTQNLRASITSNTEISVDMA